MPSLNIIRSAISKLPDGGPLVVVLPGGTTGIGSYIGNSLAKVFATQGPRLRVYIVGRNESRAESVIRYGKTTSPGSDWRFIQATDLALISEVDRACANIIQQERESPLHATPSIDLLYMSFCVNIFAKPRPTLEGLDSFLSTVYYARIRFIQQLLPLLTAGPYPGHVVSVYAGGSEDGTKPGELPIGVPPPERWGIASVRKHAGFMKTFVFEKWAEKYAGKLSLIHIFPGLVDGPVFSSPEVPSWFKIVWPAIKLFSYFYRTSPKDNGDVMVYLATAQFPAKSSTNERITLHSELEIAKSTLAERGGGSYALGKRADVSSPTPIMYERVRTAETSELVWDHTFETLNRIETENAKKT